jgi:outer membrane protein TolC
MIAHAGFPGTGLGNSITGYNLGANASWEPDLWGADARATEAARATLDQRQASLADTQVALSAQVAQAYVNLRSAQAQWR